MEGAAQHVQRYSERSSSVLQFVLACDDNVRVAVEMRGDEIRGLIHEGDGVAMNVATGFVPVDGVHRPVSVQNLTTGSLVSAWRLPLIRRAARPLPSLVASALVGSFVTALIKALTGRVHEEGASAPIPGAPPRAAPSEGGSSSVSALVALAIAGALITVIVLRRRRRGRRAWPVAVGLSLGVLAVLGAGLVT